MPSHSSAAVKHTFEVRFDEDTTLGTVAQIDEMLRGEMVEVDASATDRRRVTFDPLDIVREVGDVGPHEWARYAFDLPEPAETGQCAPDAAKMLCAMALQEWWDELRERLYQLGADVDEEPGVPNAA